jgi:hypothetical protein
MGLAANMSPSQPQLAAHAQVRGSRRSLHVAAAAFALQRKISEVEAPTRKLSSADGTALSGDRAAEHKTSNTLHWVDMATQTTDIVSQNALQRSDSYLVENRGISPQRISALAIEREASSASNPIDNLLHIEAHIEHDDVAPRSGSKRSTTRPPGSFGSFFVVDSHSPKSSEQPKSAEQPSTLVNVASFPTIKRERPSTLSYESAGNVDNAMYHGLSTVDENRACETISNANAPQHRESSAADLPSRHADADGRPTSEDDEDDANVGYCLSVTVLFVNV